MRGRNTEELPDRRRRKDIETYDRRNSGRTLGKKGQRGAESKDFGGGAAHDHALTFEKAIGAKDMKVVALMDKWSSISGMEGT